MAHCYSLFATLMDGSEIFGHDLPRSPMHCSACAACPGHALEVSLCLHTLRRDRTPLPQDTEHWLQMDHSDQLGVVVILFTSWSDPAKKENVG